VITEFQKAGCCGETAEVSYETVYLPHVVGMSMGKSKLLKVARKDMFETFCSCLVRDEESGPCMTCCDPNKTNADWVHIYTTAQELQVKAFLPIEVFPQLRVAVASAKAPLVQRMH
jgi:hypothetical protein